MIVRCPPLVILAVAVALALPAPSRASAPDQLLELTAGFNFVGVLVATADTSASFLGRTPDATQVFAFDAAAQAFRYQIRLADGSLFGAPIPLTPLRGYVIRCRDGGPARIVSSGAPDTLDPLGGLVDGFNLVPLPLLAGTKVRPFLEREPAVNSVFRWNGALGAFDFALRLPDMTLFGPDFDLGPAATAYFLRRDAASAPAYAVTVYPASATVSAGGKADLAAVAVFARLGSGEPRDVSNEAAWSLVSGPGSLDGATYLAPNEALYDELRAAAEPGEEIAALLRATYTPPNAGAVSADLTLHIVPARPVELSLSTGEVSLAPGGALDLGGVSAELVYDNGKRVAVAVVWALVPGSTGSLEGGVYRAGGAPGEAAARASLTEGAETFTRDLYITVR